jgi:hypothetical protein
MKVIPETCVFKISNYIENDSFWFNLKDDYEKD